MLPQDFGAFEEEECTVEVEYKEIQGRQTSGGLTYTMEFYWKKNGKRT